MEVSKTVRDKDPVRIRSGKVIRCPKRWEPLGYYTSGRRYRVLTLNGETRDFDIPPGISIEAGSDMTRRVGVGGSLHYLPVYSGGPTPIG